MGYPLRSTSCPGCAEEVPVGKTACPLCETPVGGGGAGGSGPAIECPHCGATAPLDASACPSCGKGLGAGGGLWMIIPIFLVLAVVTAGIFAAIAVPNFKKARERAQQRACFANQKTIAGAMEMYNLDNNTALTELNPVILRKLQEHGYLMKIPECPSRPQGGSNYSLEGEHDVRCRVHGSIAEQLERGGRR